MKAIFLNTWHATQEEALTEFINENKEDTVVFCLQETDAATRELVRSLLPDFNEFQVTKVGGSTSGGDIDVATYVHHSYEASNARTLLLDISETGLALALDIQKDGKTLSVANIHGIAFLQDNKLDTVARVAQSQSLIDAIALNTPALIGGDFNLLPEAKSITMFEDAGYQDLIKKYKIITTRNRLAWQKHPETPQYYADYVFATKDIEVGSFIVPINEASDHLPLIVTITY